MKNLVPVILLLLVVAALSGCTSTSGGNAPVQVQKISHPSQNLDGEIVGTPTFYPSDVRAGETVSADLIVANTGTETIKNESVEIKVKLDSLQDTLANLYLKTMSDDKKTRTLDAINFDTEIAPGTNKPISAVFHTISEMEGRSLAGTYYITITLSVNKEKVESLVLPITLSSGTPREFTPTPPPATPTPTPTPTPVPTTTPTPIPTTTPTPTPVVVATPTGNIVYDRVMESRFGLQVLQINAGDEVLWDNMDIDTPYTIIEMTHKIANITLKDGGKATYIFNTTGNYSLGLYYNNMRGKAPSIQNISVMVNATNTS